MQGLESRLSRWHPSLTAVFFVLGFLLATAFSTQQRFGERPGPRKQDLVEFIKKQREERERLGRQLAEVRKALSRIDSERTGERGQLAAYSRNLSRLKRKAGLKGLLGPGLEVVLGDAPRVPFGAEPESYLIHDYDLQIVVNALWRGGARAVAVNNERFVANTGIRSAGSTILINSKPQGGPYRIKATGKPSRLEKALKEDSDAALLLGEYAEKYGLILRISRKNELRLPPYSGSLGLRSSEAR